jgi:hypothetical protein
MTTTSRKIQGPWKQGLYDISATATEIVGTVREDQFGRKFAYAKAGATALAPGKMTTAPLLNADWTNESVTAAVAVGGTQVSITHVAVGSDTLAADYFRGGQLHINDAAGEGHWYPIIHSTAVTATSTTLTLTLAEGIKVALTTSSEATPVPSPYMATVISGTETHNAVGTPLVDVTAEYYYWSQIAGLGVYYSDDTPAAGSPLVMSDEDGQLMARVLDVDATSDVTDVQVIVAIAYGTAGVDVEYKPCIYCIG